MSWPDIGEGIMSTVGAAFQKRQTFTWSRPHSLHGARQSVSALAVKVAALAGVSALTLYVGSTAQLVGKAYSGLVLTIAGTDYTLGADAAAASDALAVTFTPALAADVSIDDAVTVAPNVIKTVRTDDGAALWGNYETWTLDEFGVEQFPVRSFFLRIPKNGAPFTPRKGDRIAIAALDLEGQVEFIADQTAAMWQVGVSAA